MKTSSSNKKIKQGALHSTEKVNPLEDASMFSLGVLANFWRRFHQYIYLGIVLLIAFFLVSQAYEWYHQRQQKIISQQYSKTHTLEAKQSFIKRYPQSTLAGIVSLRLADTAFTSNRYNDAIESYLKAAAVLKGTPLADRALLTCATAYVHAKKPEEAKILLKNIAEASKALIAFRAEACYQHALLDLESKDEGTAHYYLDKLRSFPETIWTYKARRLEQL